VKEIKNSGWWLHFLAYKSSQIQSVIDELDRMWYPRLPDNAYYDFMCLSRFLGPHHSASASDVVSPSFSCFSSLSQAQRWSLRETVYELAKDYAIHSIPECSFPLHALGEHDKSVLRVTSITWRQFIESGAFAACIQQYIYSLTPQEFVELFIFRRRKTDYDDDGDIVWRAPEDSNGSVFLRVSAEGDNICLSPRKNYEAEDMPSKFVGRNRLWWMENGGGDGRQLCDLGGWRKIRKGLES